MIIECTDASEHQQRKDYVGAAIRGFVFDVKAFLIQSVKIRAIRGNEISASIDSEKTTDH